MKKVGDQRLLLNENADARRFLEAAARSIIRKFRIANSASVNVILGNFERLLGKLKFVIALKKWRFLFGLLPCKSLHVWYPDMELAAFEFYDLKSNFFQKLSTLAYIGS